MTTALQSEVVIAGVGETAYERGTTKSLQQLGVEAAAAACRDAGIKPAEIDGLVLPISRMGLTHEDIFVPLGVRDLRFHGLSAIGGAGPVGAVVTAAKAIAAGMATTVLVPAYVRLFSDMRLRSGGGEVTKIFWPGSDIRSHQDFPNGLMVPMQWYSLHANRWFHETKADPVGMRDVALSTRAHAHRNPLAHFRDRELTAADYQSAPMLVTPFRLFDICIESDGGAAVIVQSADAARDRTDHRPVVIAGGGEGHPEAADNMCERTDILELGLTHVGPQVFADLGLTRESLDFAEIYDCFTFVVLRQLEELGFCARGESPDFVRALGIGPDGGLPINTHGGLLSAAHISGMNHIVEAVRQLRNEAGGTQIEGAHIGLVTGYGDFGDGSLMILHD
jgi:acetyl-CoA acetyltransferase